MFEHDSCEIWNFLAHKNYVTLKLYCANNHDLENTMDQNKAFDVIIKAIKLVDMNFKKDDQLNYSIE